MPSNVPDILDLIDSQSPMELAEILDGIAETLDLLAKAEPEHGYFTEAADLCSDAAQTIRVGEDWR